MIRAATKADIPGILAVWNPIVRDTAITFTSVEKTAEGLAAMLDEKLAAGHAFLVAETGGVVLGLATLGQFRSGAGYVHSFEHTVLLHPEARGMGLGRALITAVEEAARKAGGHTMIAGISAENPGAVAFHARLGYTQVVRLPEVGRKFGRWLDLILMQKHL